MNKRTIKPAAGGSKISVGAATSAARVVYRDGSTGRFVIVESDRSLHRTTRAEKRISDGSRSHSKQR
jgi:hypothetical protein